MTSNEILDRFSKVLTLAAIVFTLLGFIVGHFSANWYFSVWGIPYFDLASPQDGLYFLFHQPIVIIYFAVLAVAFAISVTFVSNGKVLLLGSPIFFFIWCLSLSNALEGVDIKKDIESNNYIPYELVLGKGGGTHKCLTTLGSISDYQVFLNPKMQPLIVSKSSVIEFKPMFSDIPKAVVHLNLKHPMPITEKDKKSIDDYEANWRKRWEDACGRYKDKIEFEPVDQLKIFTGRW